MFNNVVLDVFIGLIFVYLLYSLLATIIQEIISGFINLRAAVLVKAIRVMLEDRKPLDLQGLSRFQRLMTRITDYLKNKRHNLSCHLPDDTLAKAFYKHPNIKYLSSNALRTKPSYIDPKNFSSALVRVLRGKNFDGSISEMQAIYNTLFPVEPGSMQSSPTSSVEVGRVDPLRAIIQAETLDHLRQLYIDAHKDVDRFKDLLEAWFNETMERATGWYKRQTRLILFVIGLVIAIWGNVDTVKLYAILSKDKTARDQLVQMAVQGQQKYAAAVNRLKDTTYKRGDSFIVERLSVPSTGDTILDKAYRDVQDDIDKSANVLGMGWYKSSNYKRYNALKNQRTLLRDSLKKKPADSTALRKQLGVMAAQLDELDATTYDKFDGFPSILGWVLTALALTLGAPFWFDLLNKFMSIRVAGKKPEENIERHAPRTSSATAVPAAASTGTAVEIAGRESDEQPELVRDEAENATIAQG